MNKLRRLAAKVQREYKKVAFRNRFKKYQPTFLIVLHNRAVKDNSNRKNVFETFCKYFPNQFCIIKTAPYVFCCFYLHVFVQWVIQCTVEWAYSNSLIEIAAVVFLFVFSFFAHIPTSQSGHFCRRIKTCTSFLVVASARRNYG